MTGDVEIVARLNAVERTNQDAKAGLMFRESTAPDSRNVFMLAFPTQTSATGVVSGKGTRLQFRDKRVDNLTGFVDLGMLSPGTPDAAPLWLRLTRKGDPVRGVHVRGWRHLEEGRRGDHDRCRPTCRWAWRSPATPTTTPRWPASRRCGSPPSPTPAWSHAELATAGGFASGAPARFDMVNAGRGIANDEDGVTFVHRNVQHLGDIEVTGKVTALTYAATTASRIGLMLRGSMGADARMMSFVLELGPNGQRYRFQRRAQDGGNISNTEDMTVVPPGRRCARRHGRG